MVGHGFSIGGMHGWQGILLGLAGSAVFLFCGRQDLRPRIGLASAFWFFLAVLSAAGATWLSLTSSIWGGTLFGLAVLSCEALLIRRWWRQGRPA